MTKKGVAFARERLNKIADLWAQRMKLQIELACLRWDKEIDPQKVKDLFVKKAEAKAEMFLAGLEYLRGLEGILTPFLNGIGNELSDTYYNGGRPWQKHMTWQSLGPVQPV